VADGLVQEIQTRLMALVKWGAGMKRFEEIEAWQLSRENWSETSTG